MGGRETARAPQSRAGRSLRLINLPLEDASVSLMRFYHCSASYSASPREEEEEMAVNQALHLKPEPHVCSDWACGKVNNTCCSGFVSLPPPPSPLRGFNCVSPHYERKTMASVSAAATFSRVAPLAVGLLLNTKVETTTNQNFRHVSCRRRSRNCN